MIWMKTIHNWNCRRKCDQDIQGLQVQTVTGL